MAVASDVAYLEPCINLRLSLYLSYIWLEITECVLASINVSINAQKYHGVNEADAATKKSALTEANRNNPLDLRHVLQ